jgi:hypothetical protein
MYRVVSVRLCRFCLFDMCPADGNLGLAAAAVKDGPAGTVAGYIACRAVFLPGEEAVKQV